MKNKRCRANNLVLNNVDNNIGIKTFRAVLLELMLCKIIQSFQS